MQHRHAADVEGLRGTNEMIEFVVKIVCLILVIFIQWGYGAYMYNRGVKFGLDHVTVEILRDEEIITIKDENKK